MRDIPIIYNVPGKRPLKKNKKSLEIMIKSFISQIYAKCRAIIIIRSIEYIIRGNHFCIAKKKMARFMRYVCHLVSFWNIHILLNVHVNETFAIQTTDWNLFYSSPPIHRMTIFPCFGTEWTRTHTYTFRYHPIDHIAPIRSMIFIIFRIFVYARNAHYTHLNILNIHSRRSCSVSNEIAYLVNLHVTHIRFYNFQCKWY